jgi:potassium-transporting ATPase KdpC subunit
MSIRRTMRSTVVLLLALALLTGVAYPLLVTGVAQLLFPRQANGSLIAQDGRVAGSELIGQPFDDPRYFWGRPSATTPFPYNAANSAGSNLGPSNPSLAEAVRLRVAALRAANSDNTEPIPIDLVTASASGLDPNISVASALYQAPRVARERGMSEQNVEALIRRYTSGRQLGVLGEPRVNVLDLNLALDAVQ